jgi:hypothetical protein
VDDFARIGPKATPIRAQESSRDGRLKISGGGFPSQKANAEGRWKRSGSRSRNSTGGWPGYCEKGWQTWKQRNEFSHGHRASHDRFPSIAGRSGLLRDLLKSDVPAFDAYRLRNLVARSVYSAPGDRKRAQLHLSRLRFAADFDLAPLVRSFGDGRGSLIALSGKALGAARSAPGRGFRPSFWSQ